MFRRLLCLFQRKQSPTLGVQLYYRILAPETLGAVLGICALPDTLTGRFAALSLSAAVVLHGRADRATAERDLVGALVADLDVALRENSLGDASVKKQTTNHAAALYGRLRAFERGLNNLEDLSAALSRNLYADAPNIQQQRALPTILPAMQTLLHEGITQ